jgi:hypothetical protein
MAIIKQLAKHFRDVYFGGNWTTVNVKDTLAGINWQMATSKVRNLNTISALTFHINYYVQPVLKVLQGQPLVASDKYSYDVPVIKNEEQWQQLVSKALNEADLFAAQLENVDETMLFTDFADPKYGNYYRNLAGLIEHTHYHLGQIALIKKLLLAKQAEGQDFIIP